MNKLREIFNRNSDMVQMMERRHKELEKRRGCETCKNIRRIAFSLGYITREEYECTKGRECDMELFRVKDCPDWEK